MSRKSRTFDAASIAPTPWKNGGGTTLELACWPAAAGIDEFQWRVSIATIRRDGPFSAFPGIDRIIMLLQGGGVHLGSANGSVDHRLDAPWQPYAFAGEATIDCRLLQGESQDFNVMSRRESLRAELRILRDAADLQPSPHGLVYAASGSWVTDGQSLSPGNGLWWADGMTPSEMEQCSLAPASGADPILVAAQFWPSRNRPGFRRTGP